MLKDLMEKKVDNVQEQMGNVIKEIRILRKSQKEVLEIKQQKKNEKKAFNEHIDRLGITEERINKLDVLPKQKFQEKENNETYQYREHPRVWDNI